MSKRKSLIALLGRALIMAALAYAAVTALSVVATADEGDPKCIGCNRGADCKGSSYCNYEMPCGIFVGTCVADAGNGPKR